MMEEKLKKEIKEMYEEIDRRIMLMAKEIDNLRIDLNLMWRMFK